MSISKCLVSVLSWRWSGSLRGRDRPNQMSIQILHNEVPVCHVELWRVRAGQFGLDPDQLLSSARRTPWTGPLTPGAVLPDQQQEAQDQRGQQEQAGRHQDVVDHGVLGRRHRDKQLA